MDKMIIMNFAIEARKSLRDNVIGKLNFLGITENAVTKPESSTGNEVIINENHYIKIQYEHLISKLNEWGYEQFVEEVAYTWFNRFVALRYMEVNKYMPDGIYVIGSESEKSTPDIIDKFRESSFYGSLSTEKKGELVKLREDNRIDELYAKLIILQCNEFNKILPFMFEKIGDYSELLFPSGALGEKGIVAEIKKAIVAEKNEDGEEQILDVEIIGWLYQFYNSEKKDEVFAGLAKNKKITKENIPAATQLFTPKWIVKYMVENSLGKLALENLGVDDSVKGNWKYFIDNPESPLVKKNDLKIEEIKTLDPAMGSGHILVYAFDVLYQIYESLGWTAKEAVISILENNICGLEIDDRAGQLASFAVMMKAREKYRRLFTTLEDNMINLNTVSIQESNGIDNFTKQTLVIEKLEEIQKIVALFVDAKEYGSILNISGIDIKKAYEELEILKKKAGLSLTKDIENKIGILIQQANLMQSKYDVVVTNPPYMGGSGMGLKLSEFVKKNYKDSKADLFAVFMEKCLDFNKSNMWTAMITMHSWMFLSSFETLRKNVIEKTDIDSLVHLGARAFEEIGGEVVQTVAWCMRNNVSNNKKVYVRLTELKNADEKERVFLSEENRHIANQKDFEKIPGSPIAYWVSDRVKEIFVEGQKLGDIAISRNGMKTGENERFVRQWFEISSCKFNNNAENYIEAIKSGSKWFPYNKGGEYQKWYGNNDYIVNWENEGQEVIKNSKIDKRNVQDYPNELKFMPSVSWGLISSGNPSFRYKKNNLSDIIGMSFYVNKEQLMYFLAFCNSAIANKMLKIISSTMAYQSGDIGKLPVLIPKTGYENINKIVIENIFITKSEWDSRETSWDFKISPLLNVGATPCACPDTYTNEGNPKGLPLLDGNNGIKISDAYNNYCTFATDQFVQLHKNEEELNRIFIGIYGLQDEMDKYVDFEDITLFKKEKSIIKINIPESTQEERDEKEKTAEGYLYNRGVQIQWNKEEIIKQFISYAVGCMMGRYSLYKEGLILANAGETLKDYDAIVGEVGGENVFRPDPDGILPILDDDYFQDDIVNRFAEFVKCAFGATTLDDNLMFISEALGGKETETPKETLRRYFMNDFIKDHIQRYKKRPIYWMFTSGKGFSVIVYMHRYNPQTVATIRGDYLLALQKMIESKIRVIESEIVNETSNTAKNRKEKLLSNIRKQLEEMRKYDDKLKVYADRKIAIDLDDGVKVNYTKFKEIVLPISGLDKESD